MTKKIFNRIIVTAAVFAFPIQTVSSDMGLTYHLYENAALAGPASITGTTISAQLSLVAPTKEKRTLGNNIANNETTCYLSGELVGTATILNDGIYTFDCHFEGTSTGWVWIDGHLVCGDGHAYLPRDEIDNPLPIRSSKKHDYPFRAHIARNDTDACGGGVSTEAIAPSVKVYWKRDAFPALPGKYNDGVVSSSTFQLMTGGFAKQMTKELAMDSSDVSFEPRLSPQEEKREELQRSLKQGWGYWLRSSILSIVKLPEGLVVNISVCQKSTNQCLETAVPNDQGVIRVGLHAYDKSYIGYNVTFKGLTLSMECSVSGPDQEELQFLITAIDCDNSNCAEDFELHIGGRYAWFRPGCVYETPAGLSFSTPGLGDIELMTVFDDDSVLSNSGIITTLKDEDSTLRTSRQLEDVLQEGTAHSSKKKSILKIPLGNSGQKVGFVAGTKSVPSILELQATIHAKEKVENKRIHRKFGTKAAVAEAIQASVMWTYIYNPVENGPFMPVSRWGNWDFGERSGATTHDWTYTLFAWDNLFASLLAGLDNRDIAYSNLFQIVKSKTADGHIPNWSTGGVKSQDRTEPAVGAKVLLELFRKYQDTWIVDALFDDLLDWNNWFVDNRILLPKGLVGLGSHYEPHTPGAKSHTEANTMQAARWESGLDNSPMYDGDLYNSTTHMMQMYDVGMSSLFAQEAYSLAEMADAIGRDPTVGLELRNRGDGMRDLIWLHLWDPERQVFANRYVTNDFVQHVAPTSFYPMAIGAGSKDEIHGMVDSWLINASRFCLSPNGDFEGNNPDSCYWGLPSISADDPTYMKRKWIYWRGYSWGPMSQLVYWSLKNPKHTSLTAVDESSSTVRARKSLCKQMEKLMMSQWNRNRHICENYSPYKNATECSGDRYYHWGGLNGLVGMMEDGFW